MDPSDDPQLRGLIEDGAELVRRIDQIEGGDTRERLHIREMQEWVTDVERWAFANRVAIPDKGDALEFGPEWEGSADAYVLRVLERLKAHAQDDGDQGGRPDEAVPRAGDVFVSYVHDDEAVVQRLHDQLEIYGAHVWLDRDSIAPGTRWKAAIRNAIREGTFFIACFSRASVARERTYMNEELVLAIEEIRLRPQDRSWFLPVMLDSSEVPDREIGAGQTLGDFQVVDLHRDWDGGVRRLVDIIAPLPRQLRVSLDLLKSSDARERVEAADTLGRKTDRRALLALLQALDDPDAMVVYHAAKALEVLRDPRAVPALVRALKSGRGHAYKLVEVLQRFQTEEAQAALEDYRKVEDDPVAYGRWVIENREQGDGS